eukprot:9773553-Prorocentrum_lima.AAC.1
MLRQPSSHGAQGLSVVHVAPPHCAAARSLWVEASCTRSGCISPGRVVEEGCVLNQCETLGAGFWFR